MKFFFMHTFFVVYWLDFKKLMIAMKFFKAIVINNIWIFFSFLLFASCI